MSEPEDGNANAVCVRLNGKSYTSWMTARDAFMKLKATAKPESVWARLFLKPLQQDDHDGPFELRCIDCSGTCQMGNPAKWKSQHPCFKRSKHPAATRNALAGELHIHRCLCYRFLHFACSSVSILFLSVHWVYVGGDGTLLLLCSAVVL
jgi:hypothetical protein